MPIHMGVIGVGNMGSEHCRNMLSGKTPEVELTAVADRREERRRWASEHTPAVVFDEGEKLIQSGLCDAVLIATPHYQHSALAISALKQGLNVLCEKPIDVYTLAARRAVEAAHESGKTYALMFNQRTNCVYRKMKQLVEGGELGGLKRVNWIITDWYRTQRYYDSGMWRATWAGEGGGALLNQCPHQLDLLQWICGMPSAVRAFCHEGKWHNIEVEDDVTAYMEFPNGATGVFVTSTADLPGTNRLELTLERGKLVCEDGRLTLWRLPVNEREYCFECDEAFSSLKVPPEIVETDGENPQHIGVINAFAANILRGEPLVARGEEGLNGLMLSNAMHLSSWLDKTVELPIDEQFFCDMLDERRKRTKPKQGLDLTFDTDHSHGSRLI